MADARSACEQHPGMCLGDAACNDLLCPGHPARDCSTCRGGPCRTLEACQLPLADLQPINRRLFTSRSALGLLPTSPEGWGRLIGAALGFAALCFIAGAVGRHLGIF